MTSRPGDSPDADPRSAEHDGPSLDPQAERSDAEVESDSDGHAIDPSDEPEAGSPPAADPDTPDRSSARPNRDPFATAPLSAIPASDSRPAADPRSEETVGLTKPHPSPHPTPAPLFGDGLDEPTSGNASYPQHPEWRAAEAPPASIFDDAPTEAIPTAAAAGGRHRADADDDVVTEWRGPRKTSRMTMILVLAVLVALGFFAGVLVGRSAAGHTPSGDAARPAATGSARPGTLR